jgi:bis(5'-nucleosyl)-tetraphosphatase (symmetrical)
MRYLDRRGRIDLSYSGAPGTQPKGLVPWFDVPERRASRAQIVFGHWAALGLLRRSDVMALDTGCVWGNHLTAVRLDRPARPVKVSAEAAKRWQRWKRRRR